MIYLFAALTCEVEPIARRLKMKPLSGNLPFRQMISPDESVLLTLTGTGPVAAAAAVGGVLAARNATAGEVKRKGDFLLSIGSCAGLRGGEKGSLYLANKLTGLGDRRTFYPDLLINTEFAEGEVITVSRIWNRDDRDLTASLVQMSADSRNPVLVDMEAAAIYQTGALYFGPHEMSFLRLVTDSGNGGSVTGEQISEGFEGYARTILDYISAVKTFCDAQAGEDRILDPDGERVLDKFQEDIHCSETMKIRLRQLVAYMELAGIPWKVYIKEFYDMKRVPCRDRKNGKQILERLKKAAWET